MGALVREIGERARHSILVRPLLFAAAGLATALVMLGLDAAGGPQLLPAWVHFEAATARLLFTTLAGATLTIAGITFWVRAAAVQMAASQFTPRVVQGFLHDWFQQSMMGLLVGIFAYVVVVLRATPEAGPAPHLSVLVGIVLGAGSVLAVLWAIRNGVESMQAGELARRLTDQTVERIRAHHPPGAPPPDDREPDDVPVWSGHIVRASSSGWVQSIDERRILHALDDGAIVRLEVRVGLFVREGRALCTIWDHEGVWLDVEPRVRRAIRLGRSRTTRNDVHYGLQQLADVARGSLTHGTADTGAATEAILHLDMILRELLGRSLPPVAYADGRGRRMIRRRDYSLDDYVHVAYDELRSAAAPHPSVVVVLLDTIADLVRDLERSNRADRAAPLRTQARLLLAACEQADLLEEERERIRSVAARQGLARSPGGRAWASGADRSGGMR